VQRGETGQETERMIKEKGRKRKRKRRGERQGEINEELGLISPGGDLTLRYLPQTTYYSS